MVETFDSDKFMTTVGDFLDHKFDEFSKAPPHKKGVLLGRFAKEIITFAIPAGAHAFLDNNELYG